MDNHVTRPRTHKHTYVYVCMDGCMSMYVWTDVCLYDVYLCMDECMSMYVRTYGCMYMSMFMYVWTDVCLLCMYGRMYVYVYVYLCMSMFTYVWTDVRTYLRMSMYACVCACVPARAGVPACMHACAGRMRCDSHIWHARGDHISEKQQQQRR